MKRAFILGVIVGAAFACQGPPAEDAAICRDIINRLCAPPICDAVTEDLETGLNCIEDLTARSGCGSDDFVFGEQGRPSRERMLECRLPLVRSSDSVNSAPRCEEVEEAFARCADLPRFFDGGTP